MLMTKRQRAIRGTTLPLDLVTKKTENIIHLNIQACLNLSMFRDKNWQLNR